ncbi:hypothetical protein ACA910_001604 [Epithemia clementina (nom. ined.)]
MLQDKSEIREVDFASSAGKDVPPVTVKAMDHFKGNVHALEELARSPTCPRSFVRPTRAGTAMIMFGDASGTGFGTSLWLQGSSQINTKHGIWIQAYRELSSNFRELFNLVAWVASLLEY